MELIRILKCKRAIETFRRPLLNSALINPTVFRNPFRSYLEWTNKTTIMDSWTDNESLKDWIHDQISHFQPSRVHLCDGSIQEYDEIVRFLTAQGTLIKLNDKLPNSYLARSVKSDVARMEECTYICSESKADAGPTNNWRDPQEMTKKFEDISENAMRGRTMYVVPFCMGPINSKYSLIGIQITDSPLVVAQMRIMTRIGISVMKKMGKDTQFIPCIHTVGAPLGRNDMDTSWPCNETKMVIHLPEQQRVMSFGSGYGGNALLGKKCLALRIASAIGKKEGWLAEHMLIIGVTNPEGRKKYIAAAFPSACGKTNMAMLRSSLPGWKIECLGDDIAWMHLGEDGRLYAINPEFGFFGVAPGTSNATNPNMMDCLRKDTIYTNVGITDHFDVWWEGKTAQKPKKIITWLKKEWKHDDPATEIAHANSRFCVPLRNCKILDPNWDNPEGVPIDAIVFGGRRSETIPLVYQSRSWTHGVFLGSVMGSETTAAAVGRRGLLRIDPFAMKPFCSYNMGDYFKHWIKFEALSAHKKRLPKIFGINWFRKQGSRFVWPGFGDNIRVIKWIFDRCDGHGDTIDTPIGLVPKAEDIDISGLDLTSDDMNFLLKTDPADFKTEIGRYREFYDNFDKTKFPQELLDELSLLEKQVKMPQKDK